MASPGDMTADKAAVAPPIATPAMVLKPEATAFNILIALSASHFLNDLLQSMLTALYPLLKAELALDFGQIGLISMTFMLTSSILQPVIGTISDRRPMPYSLSLGMGFSLCGVLLLSIAHTFPLVLLSALLIGIGSSIFHPESSRMARLASGGRPGLAQSFFQVGGNAGSAVGPLAAAVVVVSRGQSAVAWFSLAALVGMTLLFMVGRWYAGKLALRKQAGPRVHVESRQPALPRGKVIASVAILLALLFSKNIYTASISSYYTFFLIEHFGVSIRDSQFYLFLFLFSLAAGILVGGPLGDRIGRKPVIWFSFLGALPFTLALPYANFPMTIALSIIIALIISSAFSSIIVYAQELLPGRIGLVSGLFFGFSFGVGGIGAAALGLVADHTSLNFVYRLCSFLPAHRNPRSLSARVQPPQDIRASRALLTLERKRPRHREPVQNPRPGATLRQTRACARRSQRAHGQRDNHRHHAHRPCAADDP